MTSNEEQHILFRAIKDYWPQILIIATLVSIIGSFGARISDIENKVEAKADKDVVEAQLRGIEQTLSQINKKVDTLLELHLEK